MLRLRSRIPNLFFRTAFIVGHPGETDEEFEELCEFVRFAEFDRVGVFQYSENTALTPAPCRTRCPPAPSPRAPSS